MNSFKRVFQFFKTQATRYRRKLKEKIKTIKDDPLAYLVLSLFKTLEMTGNMCICPFRTAEPFEKFEDMELIPSEGIHLHLTTVISLMVVVRSLPHFALGFSNKFQISQDGCLTLDGLVFALTSGGFLVSIYLYWVLRMKRERLAWFIGQFLKLIKTFSP